MHSKKQHLAHCYHSQTASKDPWLQARLLKFDIYETWSLKANYILFLLIYVFHLRYIFSWSKGSDLFFITFDPYIYSLAHHVVFVNLLPSFFFKFFYIYLLDIDNLTCLILTGLYVVIFTLHLSSTCCPKFGICGQI